MSLFCSNFTFIGVTGQCNNYFMHLTYMHNFSIYIYTLLLGCIYCERDYVYIRYTRYILYVNLQQRRHKLGWAAGNQLAQRALGQNSRPLVIPREYYNQTI